MQKTGKMWEGAPAYMSTVCVSVGEEGDISMKLCSTRRKHLGICKSPSNTQEIAWLPMGYNVTGRPAEPTCRWVPGEPVPGGPRDKLGSSCPRTEPGLEPWWLDCIHRWGVSLPATQSGQMTVTVREYALFLDAFPVHITSAHTMELK